MTNKEAIVHLKCFRNLALGDVMKEALTKAIEALENSSWIPVSEGLPDKYDSYLIMWRSSTKGFPDRLFYEICEYEPEEDEWERIEQAGESGAEIVAWMPLPERYKPKEDSDHEKYNQ